MNNNVKLVPEIVQKIKVLPLNTEITIAEMINYNPEINFVEPFIQGQIFNTVKDICKKENIYIEKNIDEIGGLPFYFKFKKVENKNAEIVINEIVNYIINMNVGEKCTIKSIYEHVINKLNITVDIDLLNVQHQVENMCEKKGIILDYSAYNGQIVGVPYSLEFVKKIIKEDECMNKEFKIENYKFEDEETKIEFQKYLDEVNEYNRKVLNGEEPDIDLAAIANKFYEKFEIKGVKTSPVENKNIDELSGKLNQRLDSDYTNSDLSIDELIQNIDKRIEELNKLEDSNI